MLLDGIYQSSSGDFKFDFENDNPEDLLKLLPQKVNSKIHKIRGFNIYYGYKFGFEGNRKLPYMSDDPYISNGIVVNLLRSYLKHGRAADYPNWEKDLSSSDQDASEYIDKMISISLDRFEKMKPLSEFGTVIQMPSSSDVNDRIGNQIKKRVGKNTKILSDVFIKNAYSKVGYYKNKFKKLNPQARQLFLGMFNSLKNKNGEVEIKNVKASFRQIINGFLKIKYTINIKNHDVLLVDDTIGSGGTFQEAIRLIRSSTPKDIWLYALLKDY